MVLPKKTGCTMKNKILIATSTFSETDPAPLDTIKKAGFEPVMNPYGRTLTEAEVIALGSGCIGVISGSEPLNSWVIEHLPDLRCISRVGIGLDNIDLDSAEKKKIVVRNTPDAPTRAVAELTIGQIFNLLRNISRQDRMIRTGSWKKIQGELLVGKTLGVVGLGRIGRSVALLAKALGMTVIGTDLFPNPSWAKNYGITLKSFEEILSESDIISIHIPFSVDNRSLIGVRELQMMKRGAFLLNLSRGGIVDEDALYDALNFGRIAGAAVDTFQTEPYSGRLKSLDNVVLTPHIGSHTIESRQQMESEAVENLLQSLHDGKGK